MAVTNILSVLNVADLDAALGWYARLVGRPADRHPMQGLAEWQVTETGGIQVFRDPARAGGGGLTLAVDDLEGQISDLAARGIAASPIQAGDAVRFATIADPDGNAITFAQPKSASRGG